MKKSAILALSVLVLAGVSCGRKPPGADEGKDISVQLYSVRSIIGEQYPAILSELSVMGFTSVEAAGYGEGKFYGQDPAKFRSDVETAGMRVLSSHVTNALGDAEFSSGDFSGKLQWWDKAIADHKEAGMRYIVTPWMGPQKSLEDLQLYCDYLNAVGKKCADAGILYGYHNHAYEFEKVGDCVMFDYMLEHTDPRYVFFEMDVYWTVIGNASPVEYFRKYPGRFRLLHIKDDKEIGQSGMVGFDAIFRSAQVAGVENVIVEVERYSYDDVKRSVRESIDYLKEAPFVKSSYGKK